MSDLARSFEMHAAAPPSAASTSTASTRCSRELRAQGARRSSTGLATARSPDRHRILASRPATRTRSGSSRSPVRCERVAGEAEHSPRLCARLPRACTARSSRSPTTRSADRVRELARAGHAAGCASRSSPRAVVAAGTPHTARRLPARPRARPACRCGGSSSVPVGETQTGPAIVETATTTVVIDGDASFSRRPTGTLHIVPEGAADRGGEPWTASAWRSSATASTRSSQDDEHALPHRAVGRPQQRARLLVLRPERRPRARDGRREPADPHDERARPDRPCRWSRRTRSCGAATRSCTTRPTTATRTPPTTRCSCR